MDDPARTCGARHRRREDPVPPNADRAATRRAVPRRTRSVPKGERPAWGSRVIRCRIAPGQKPWAGGSSTRDPGPRVFTGPFPGRRVRQAPPVPGRAARGTQPRSSVTGPVSQPARISSTASGVRLQRFRARRNGLTRLTSRRTVCVRDHNQPGGRPAWRLGVPARHSWRVSRSPPPLIRESDPGGCPTMAPVSSARPDPPESPHVLVMKRLRSNEPSGVAAPRAPWRRRCSAARACLMPFCRKSLHRSAPALGVDMVDVVRAKRPGPARFGSRRTRTPAAGTRPGASGGHPFPCGLGAVMMAGWRRAPRSIAARKV
jgi:hypothetical protein